jgi:hypothetical protein
VNLNPPRCVVRSIDFEFGLFRRDGYEPITFREVLIPQSFTRHSAAQPTSVPCPLFQTRSRGHPGFVRPRWNDFIHFQVS